MTAEPAESSILLVGRKLFNMSFDPTGKNITLMGLGRFGGGLGVARWLAHQGAIVTITDLLQANELSDSINQISQLIHSGSIILRLGEHIESDFKNCDMVIANPAIPKPWENSVIQSPEVSGNPGASPSPVILKKK